MRTIFLPSAFSTFWRRMNVRSISALITAMLLLAQIVIPAKAYAIDAANLKAVINDTVFYDPCADPGEPIPAESTGKKVYQVGNSITHQMESPAGGIIERFEAAGWEATTNGVNSSALFNPPGHAEFATLPRDGFAALETDRAKVAEADAVVVEFGTNTTETDDQFRQKIGEYIDAIHAIKSDVDIYWVDIFSTGFNQEHATRYSNRNRIIYEQAAIKNYRVIEAYKELSGADDPFNIDLSLASTYLPDKIHPSDEAREKLMDLIVRDVTGVRLATPNDCNCGGGGSGTLPDSVPEPYNEIFTRAGQKHNVEPALVAGIFHYGEHGGSNGAGWPNPPPPYGTAPSFGEEGYPWRSSPVGASGPFQFMPATWEGYKDDGTDPPDGTMDIQDLEDSAFGAAKYLAANGGTAGAPLGDPHGGAQAASISNAIWHYNHADWYVDNVLEGYYLYGGAAGASGGVTPPAASPAPGASSSGGCAQASGEFQWPTEPLGSLLACWGDQRGSHLHSGLDIAVPTGSKVLAADAGTVEEARVAGGYGNVIVINHNNGYWTLYGHNDSLMVAVGDSVTKGQQIAVSGNTGASQGPHLHFNVQQTAGVQGDASNTVNPLTNGLIIPEGVDNQAHCENFPDGGRDTGFRS